MASDPTTFVSLLTRSQKPLHAYIYALTLNLTDADEILQETNMRLWEQRDDYDPDRPFMAWAKTIAHYQVLSSRTKQSRERLRFRPAVLESLSDEAAAAADAIEQRRSALQNCVEKLNDSSRRLLRLCYFGDTTIKQAANQLDRSVAATYKALARIRQTLFDCVEKQMQENNA